MTSNLGHIPSHAAIERKSVAYIGFDNPYLKPMEGGKRGMLSRIRALQRLDIDLDVFLLNKPSEGMADLSGLDTSDRCMFTQYRMLSIPSVSALVKYPTCVARRYVPELAAELGLKEYDAVLYEGAQVASYRFEDRVRAKRHILYYLDIESAYRAQLSSSEDNPISKLLQAREGKLFAKMEGRLPDLFDSHLFLSCDECEIFGREHGLGSKAKYAPYAVDYIVDAVPVDVVPGRLLYIGDMMLASNYHSVEWFVREVLPSVHIAGKDVELRLVGRIDDSHARHLASLDNRVNVVGYADDLEKEYKSAACMVSPILSGAGVKVKLMDALAHGQIVVANTKACEGTKLLGSGCLLVADDPAGWAACCNAVLSNRDAHLHIAEKALLYMRDVHSLEAHVHLLASAINEGDSK